MNTKEIFIFTGGGNHISSGTIVGGWHPSPQGWSSVSALMERIRDENRMHGSVKCGVGETHAIRVRQDGEFFQETRTATMTEYGLRLD